MPRRSKHVEPLAGVNPLRRLHWQAICCAVWLLGLTAFFLAVSLPNLANFRPISNDDAWIASASYKLATQGIFGSDLYAGFYGADQHYFIALPAHHLWQALSFRVLGPGIAQARLVALAGGLSLIWSLTWLAYRWYGLTAAITSSFLLVLWRSDLISHYPGLPLLGVARSGRYDADGVAWIWLSIGLLVWTLQHRNHIAAFGVGLCAGMAVLTQFFGAFVLPLLGVVWLWQRGRRAFFEPISYSILVGFALVVGPYLVYCLAHYDDMVGQYAMKSYRIHFDSWAFYLTNLWREPSRFAHLWRWPLAPWDGYDFQRPFSPWLLPLSIVPALVWLWRRTRTTITLGDGVLGGSLLGFGGLLALFDTTKAPLYAIVVLPPLCLLLGAFWARLWHSLWSGGLAAPLRVGGLILMLAGGLLLAYESAQAYREDIRQSAEATPYLALGQRIAAAVPPGAVIVGPDRFWWPLRDHRYLALYNIWLQWELAAQASAQVPDFRAWVRESQADYLLINSMAPGDPFISPPQLRDQFWGFVDGCTTLEAEFNDHNYGQVKVYRIAKAASGALDCQS